MKRLLLRLVAYGAQILHRLRYRKLFQIAAARRKRRDREFSARLLRMHRGLHAPMVEVD